MLLSKLSKTEYFIYEMEKLFKRVTLDGMPLYGTIKFEKIASGYIDVTHRNKIIGTIMYAKEIKELSIDIYSYTNGSVYGETETFEEYNKVFNSSEEQKHMDIIIHNLMLAAIEVVMANRDNIDLGTAEK